MSTILPGIKVTGANSFCELTLAISLEWRPYELIENFDSSATIKLEKMVDGLPRTSL